MKIIQGFVQIPSLSDNVVDSVAPFGEFSVHSQTFTKDIRNYADTKLYPHIEIITTKVIDEKSLNIPIPEFVQSKMLHVANWIYTQYTNSEIPLNNSKATLENGILAEFKFTQRVHIGEIMNTSEPSKRLIDYITFDIEDDGVLWRTTLWYNDSRFRVQYRYFDIIVIPPIDDINRLIGRMSDVSIALSGVTLNSITNKINHYNVQHKVTNIHTLEIPWVDINNEKSRITTNWTLLVHGNAGSDTEAMKAAVRDYLDANSDAEDWPKRFPTLYSSNEFILVPFWGDYATQGETYDDGLYRTMSKMSDLVEVKNKFIPSTYKYGKNHDIFFNTHATVMSVFYRTMMVYSIGNPANKDNTFSMVSIFPDYMAVSTQVPDFARMSKKTQKFVLKLNDCMNKARLYNPTKGVPEGYTMSLRATREYLGFDYEGFTYYVLTRHGYLREV